MNTSLTIDDIDRLIKKEEKRYGNALGKVLSGGIGDTEAISRLAVINADYNALLKLREALTPKPEPEKPAEVPTVYVDSEETNEEDEYMLPEGICASEDCEDEFCVEYWEKIEGNA